MLTSLLRPSEPIARVTVLDPKLPKDLATDRSVRLDVLVELEGGKLVDVEMQCDVRRAHGGSVALSLGAELQRWARFLRFEDERALDSLATESPIMADAKHALEVLSREPSAQRIAEMRREAEIARRLDRAEDLAEGREQGLAEGRQEGLVVGRETGLAEGREQERAALTARVESFCSAFGIELDEERRATLGSLDEAGLASLLDALFARRAWP